MRCERASDEVFGQHIQERVTILRASGQFDSGARLNPFAPTHLPYPGQRKPQLHFDWPHWQGRRWNESRLVRCLAEACGSRN